MVWDKVYLNVFLFFFITYFFKICLFLLSVSLFFSWSLYVPRFFLSYDKIRVSFIYLTKSYLIICIQLLQQFLFSSIIRVASSKSGKVYLHTDIRLIFARHKPNVDSLMEPYELKSFTEGPQNPKYSPKK